MKLFRYGNKGEEQPGIVSPDGILMGLDGFGETFDSDFLASDGIARLKRAIEAGEIQTFALDANVRLGPPIPDPGKIVCVGLNYSDHAIESGMDIPEEPILFFKATTSLCGPNDNVMIPFGGTKLDWEVELAVIIGSRTSHVTREEASEFIAGYCVLNDYSERSFQLERGGQWVKGKSCDTFSPLGPYLVTQDEVPNPNALDLWLDVNGTRKQQSNTSNFVFDIAEVVSYISKFMTLMPGDIISTGTPPGVGLGFDPPQYLKPGDVVELGIEGLGSSRQKVVPYSPA